MYECRGAEFEGTVASAQGRSVYRSMHQQDPATYIADLEQERACTEASHYALQHDLPGCAGDCEACSGLCAHLIMMTRA